MVADTQLTEEDPAAVEAGEDAPADRCDSAEVAALREELERTERRLQQVVERYEALLAERSRASRGDDPVWTDDRATDDGGRGLRSWLRSLL